MTMTKESMIVSMQMSLSSSSSIEYFLFEKFTIMNGGTFFAVLCLTAFTAFVSEAAGFVIKNYHSSLNPLIYFVLKVLNYSQMLMVMTYNIWVILTLVVSQVGFSLLFQSIK